MLTLTLKQHLRVAGTARRLSQHGYKSYQKLDRFIAEKVAAQFIERLNAEVFHTAARRYGKSLFYLPVLERGDVSGRLHLHIGIGAIPIWARGTELYRAVGRAAKESLNKSPVYLSEGQRLGAQRTRTGDGDEEQANDAGEHRV